MKTLVYWLIVGLKILVAVVCLVVWTCFIHRVQIQPYQCDVPRDEAVVVGGPYGNCD